MTMIASYFAQVGVGVDRSSLVQVQNYLDSIHKKLTSFQARAAKTTKVTLRINNFAVNASRLSSQINAALSSRTFKIGNVELSRFTVRQSVIQRSIRAAINGTANMKTQGVVLSNFHVNQKSLVDAINGALNQSGRHTRIRLGALLSQNSLKEMRDQIRSSINGLVVNPKINPVINPRVNPTRQPRGSSGGGGEAGDKIKSSNPHSGRINPWHNPMMVGGGVGAFMRYGMFSLPFVAGTFGLNTLANTSAELQSQRIALQMTAGESVGDDGVMRDGDYYSKFLDGLGDRLGKTTQMMTPFFTQMLAGSRGTDLEPHLESGFESLMQYSSVMGLGEESIKGAIRAFTQMIL